jgi:hypothetical protein
VPSRTLHADVVRVFDSNATLLGLLLVNFFVLELVDNERVGAFVSSVIAALALATAIYDSSTGRKLTRWQSVAIIATVILSAWSSLPVRATCSGRPISCRPCSSR